MEIQIRRLWNNYNIATTHLEALESLHWDSFSGGTYRRAPQPFVHGFVSCMLIDGDIDHSCTHGPPPHSIKVCIVKKDNSKEAWNKILEIVGPKPTQTD